MTAATIARAAVDQQLRDRVTALAQKEVLSNDALADTQFGQRLLQGMADISPLMWGVAVDYEAAYESALAAGRGAPGHDVDIITDGNVSAAIVAHWPQDPEPPTGPP